MAPNGSENPTGHAEIKKPHSKEAMLQRLYDNIIKKYFPTKKEVEKLDAQKGEKIAEQTCINDPEADSRCKIIQKPIRAPVESYPATATGYSPYFTALISAAASTPPSENQTPWELPQTATPQPLDWAVNQELFRRIAQTIQNSAAVNILGEENAYTAAVIIFANITSEFEHQIARIQITCPEEAQDLICQIANQQSNLRVAIARMSEYDGGPAWAREEALANPSKRDIWLRNAEAIERELTYWREIKNAAQAELPTLVNTFMHQPQPGWNNQSLADLVEQGIQRWIKALEIAEQSGINTREIIEHCLGKLIERLKYYT